MNLKKFFRLWSPWGLCFIFLLLAGITRFSHLDWSFWGDETSTFLQVKEIFETPFFGLTSGGRIGEPDPIGYILQGIVYRFFGQEERATRMGVAAAGTLAIGLIVLLTSRLYDQVTGVILGMMLVLSPWHLFHSQNQRNYSYVFLFGAITLMAAAFAWKQDNKKWALLAGIASALTVTTHTISIVIPASLLIFGFFEFVYWKTPFPLRAIKTYLLWSTPFIILISLWAWLCLRNWSEVQGWGYTSLHTVMGLAFNLNWGVTLTACAGWVWAMWFSKEAVDRLWGSVALVVAGVALLFPIFLIFRHDYVFSSTLVFFMLAARLVTQIYESLKRQSLLLALTVTTVFILLPLPSFVSYYQDGDRPDYRTAAKFIMEHYQPGDIIVCASWTGVLRYYLPFKVNAISDLQNGTKSIAELNQLASSEKRLWLVDSLAREEYPSEVDRWLWQHAVRMLRIKKKRFDFHENITDVYVIKGNPKPSN